MEQWTFSGRGSELSSIISSLADRSVAITGPTGVGKTRLALEALRNAQQSGAHTVRLAAISADRSIPLLPLRPLLGETSTGDVVGRIHTFLGLGPNRPGHDPVILVDDAHLLDDQSAAVLHQVLVAQRARLLLTVEGERSIPSSVSQILRSDLLQRIPLEPFSPTQTQELLSTVFTDPFDGRTVAQFVESSRGNALVLRELLAAAQHAGSLTKRNGLWTLAGSMGASLILNELLEHRTQFLHPTEREGLQLIAVGGPMPLALLVSATSLPTIEALEEHGLVTTTTKPLNDQPTRAHQQSSQTAGGLISSNASTWVDVAHPVYRELLLGGMGELAKKRCFRQLAELAATGIDNDEPNVTAAGTEKSNANTENHYGDNESRARNSTSPKGLRSTPRPSLDLDQQLQLAVWRLLGEVALPPRMTLRAARHAATLNDLDLAGELAIASYHNEPTIEAAVLACWALSTTGRQAQAEAFALAAQKQLPEPQAQAALALRRSEERWWWGHDLVGARTILREAAASLEEPWTNLLAAQIGVFEALNGNAIEALRIGELFITSPSLWVRRVASIALGFGYALHDRVDDATAVADRAYREALDDPRADLTGDPGIHIVCRLFAGVYGSDSASMLDLAEAVYNVAVHQPGRQVRGWAALLLGMTQLVRGRPTSAARSGLEAELLWADSQVPGVARWATALVALAQLDLGQTEAATLTADRIATYESAGFGFGLPVEARVFGRLANLSGESQKASELLMHGATEALRIGAIVTASDCLEDLVHIGDLDAALRLAELLPLGRGLVTDLRRQLLNALCTDDPAAIEAAGDAFAATGRDLSAAKVFRQASVRHQAHKDFASATRCAAKAAAMLNACEGVPESEQPHGQQGQSDILSPRERGIAELAADGLSNRSIAEKLVISERTVESHLYRIFAKLGISTREAISTRIGRG